MKYFVTFITIASISLYYGFNNPGYLWLSAWISFSFYYVGLCYFGMIPGFFKKNGKIPVLNKILNAPYLCLTTLTWHIYKKCVKEPAINRISDSLFIGRRLLSGEFDLYKIDIYLDLTSEFDEVSYFRKSSKYLNFQILDADYPKIDKLTNLLKDIKGKKLFIHCAQGHGRTGLVAISILIADKKVESIEEGLGVLQKERPALGLNAKQTTFLKEHLCKLKSVYE